MTAEPTDGRPSDLLAESGAAAGDRAAAIFFALSQVPSSDRSRMLDQQCGGDALLRGEVERLLARLGNSEDRPLTPGDSTLAVADGASLPTGAVIGDFVVIRQIGAGGTGVVHLAHQRHPSRIVALKVLRREFLASAVQRRFEIEAELLAHLQHPGIAQIYAAHPGDETTPPFIAMELVDGPPLTEYADSHALTRRNRVELMARVCDAVQHAHQRGIIHRDLKPGNILVGEDEQPKVLDFGVARRLEQVSPATIATETGQLVGTLAYMSPEQVQAIPDAIDTRTDIHALGVILFRLLTGRLPFAHDDPSLPELARRILQDEATKIGTIDPAMRGDLETIVARALAKEKERRYASVSALAADLRRYLDGRPISASSDSAWYVVRRQLGRYRLAFALSAVMLAVVSTLAVYALAQRRHADGLNVELREQLATNTIERARLLAMTGNQPAAEELAWGELFRNPDARDARWALWEMYSREANLWTQVLHDQGTYAVRFSPDGRFLLTTGRTDGLLHLVEVGSGKVVRTFTTTPRSGAKHSFFTADGRAIVSGSEDGTLRVWDVATGELRREIPRAMPVLFDLSISPDGATAITVALRRVERWSLTEGTRVADLTGHVYPASAAEISPVAPVVVIGGDRGEVAAVDLGTGRKIWEVRGHAGLITGITFTADGKTVATGSFDGYVRLWDPRNGRLLRAIDAGSGRVRNIAFDSTGTILAAGAQWRSLVWNLANPDQPPRDMGGSEGTTDVDITADGRALATCHGATGQVRLWDLVADSRVARWKQPGSARAMSLGPDGESIVTASMSSVVTWRPGVSTTIGSIQIDGVVAGLDVSRNGQWLATVGAAGVGAIWNLADGRRLAQLADVGAARAITFSADDRMVFTGERGGMLRVWRWHDGIATPVRETASAPDGEILALAAHGSRVFVAYSEHAVVPIDAETGQELKRLQTLAAPFSVAVSPNGRWVAAGTYLGAVYIWDANTGQPIDPVKGQTAIVNGVDFSPDSSLLAITSRDGSTRLWDVEKQVTLAVIAARSIPAESVRFLADGRRLAIGYATGDIELIDLDHFHRHIAGNAEYQLSLFRAAGEVAPRAGEVIERSRKLLDRR